ncbi:hypothetical protein [Halorarum halobium]|uniref:hypothetical protein n=1 Tax=Halorarum halobium TaxID=3075121 RepID=UPI0028AA8B94|nr:hypothetical protein [Halobaculum sp. XH14]
MGSVTASSNQSGRPTGTPGSTPGSTPDGSGPVETSFSGAGADVTKEFRVEREGPTVLRLGHESAGRFAVTIADADGTQLDLRREHDAAWTGTYALALSPGECTLTAGAAGQWSAEVVQQPRYALGEVQTQWPVAFEGTTPAVDGPIDFSAARTLSVTAAGGGTNTVAVRDASGAIAALSVYGTEAVETTTDVSIPGDVGWLSVEPAGEFSVTLEE